MSKLSLFIGVIALTFATLPASAQEESAEKKACMTTQACITKNELLGNLDLAAPTHPLFILMGATPENVITPKTGDELTMSVLPQAIDAFGKESSAFAVEVNPGLLMLKSTLKPEELFPGEGKTSPLDMARYLSLFTISGVVSRQAEEDGKSQYGLGLAFNWDSKTPLINYKEYQGCIAKHLDRVKAVGDKVNTQNILMNKALDKAGVRQLDHSKYLQKAAETEPENVGAVIATFLDDDKVGQAAADAAAASARPEERETVRAQKKAEVRDLLVNELTAANLVVTPLVKEYDSVLGACLADVTYWNRPVYSGGLATYVTKTNQTTLPTTIDDNVSGFGAWASVALPSPFKHGKDKSDGQFLLHGRYTEDLVRERGKDANAVTESVDGWMVGARYVHQFSASPDQASKSANAFRGFIEAGYTEEKFSGIRDKFWQAGIGAEIQVSKDLFLQLVVGDTFSSSIDRSTYLSGQLKWSFSKAPAK